MERLALALALVLLLCAQALGAWDKGWNFRASSTFVTDGANETYVIDSGNGNAEEYPVTRNGVTFGWGSNQIGNVRDRLDTNDRRLAGTQWGNALAVFQVDLVGAADYIIDAAFGDPAGGATNIGAKFYDNTTVVATIANTSNSSGEFVDASGVNRTSAANWVANHATIQKTFATTTFKLELQQATSGMVHLFLSQVAAAAATPTRTLTGAGI